MEAAWEEMIVTVLQNWVSRAWRNHCDHCDLPISILLFSWCKLQKYKSWDSTFSANSTKARRFQLCSECLNLTSKLLVSGQQAQFVRIALAFGLTVSSCRRNLWGWFEVKSGLSGGHPGSNYWTCVRLPYQPCSHCWTYHRGKSKFSNFNKSKFSNFKTIVQLMFRLVCWKALPTLWCSALVAS